MAKSDGLQYYSGVGRGAGTIIQSPDFRGMFAQAAKSAQAAQASKDKAKDDQQAWLNKAIDLGDKGWEEDATYLDGIRTQFTNDYSAALAKYEAEGKTMPANVAQSFVSRANKYRFEAQNSQKQRDEYFKFAAKIAGSNLDDETRANADATLNAWVATPTNERGGIEKFYLEKKFDYTKTISAISKLVSDNAIKTAQNYGPQNISGGKFTKTETYKFNSFPLAEQALRAEYSANNMFQKRVDKQLAEWKADPANASGTTNYTYYDYKSKDPQTGKPLTDEIVAFTVNNQPVQDENDYIKYVLAPQIVSLQEGVSVSMSGNTNIGITTTPTTPMQGVPPFSTYNASRTLSDGSQRNYNYPAYSDDSNSQFTKPPSGQTKKFTTNSFTISSPSSSGLNASTNYGVDAASTDLLPVASKTFTINTSGGVLTVKAGQRLVELPGTDINMFLNDVNNRGKWSWQANYNITAKDQNTGEVYAGYEDIDDDRTFSNNFVMPPGSTISYFDYQKKREAEMNRLWNITSPSSTTPQNQAPTTKPSYPTWKAANPNGTYQQWSAL
jgi:hypothetical protein